MSFWNEHCPFQEWHRLFKHINLSHIKPVLSMGKTLTPSSSLIFSCKIYRNSKLFCQNCTKHWFLEKHSKILPWVRSYLTEIEYFYVFSSLNIWNIMTIFGMIGSISELDPKQQIYTLKQAREVWGVENCTLLWLSWALLTLC